MQNLKANWLLLAKLTWAIWEIFTRALESLKIGTLMGFFCPKLKMHDLKIYWGIMCQENEEWCTNWRGIDFLVQTDMNNLTKFDSSTQKSQKICTLMGCLWPKYMFDLQKFRGVIFDGTEYWCKIWRKTAFCFQKWHKEFGKFSPEHLKVSKFGLWDSFKSKVENVWTQNLRGNYLSWQWKRCKTGRGTDLTFQNWDEGFDEFKPKHSKISRICTLMGFFWAKYIIFDIKKYRGVMFDSTEYWCNIWRKTDLCF